MRSPIAGRFRSIPPMPLAVQTESLLNGEVERAQMRAPDGMETWLHPGEYESANALGFGFG